MELNEYRKKYFEGLERGLPRLKGIRNALDEALQTQDADGALQLYYEYMEEDCIHSDAYRAVLLFPEYVAFFEQHPELHEDYTHDLMWSYKWILGDVNEYPQIPLSKIENIYHQYADFCKRFNYSLRSYYNLLWQFITEYIGIDKTFCGVDAKEAHRKMLLEKRDNLCDCLACETSDESYYYERVEKNVEKAIEVAEPVLSGQLHCVTQPHCTLANAAEAYLECGNLEKADIYATRAARRIMKDFGNEPNLMIKKSLCILTLSFIKPQEAVKIFRRSLNFAAESNNLNEQFEFFRASYFLMRNLDEHEVDEIKVRLPYPEDPVYNDSNIYKPAVLKDFFYAKAKELAERFDKRDDNTLFIDRLNFEFKPDYDAYVPYEAAPDCPYLEYIRDNMEEGQLPEHFSLPNPEKNENGEKMDDGMYDAFTLFSGGLKKAEIDDLEKILRFAVRRSEIAAAAKTDRFFENSKVRALSLVDNLQQYIIDNQENLPADVIYDYAVELVVSGRQKESVKLGLCILELFSDFNDNLLQAIKDLAQCNEFTLFCLWVLKKSENGNELVFETAKQVYGWGRIVAMNYLEPETDEIREWIVIDGLKNQIYPGYSAIEVFRKGEVHRLLEEGLTQELLTPVGADLVYLIVDGPTDGIKIFEDADDIVNMYLDSAEKLELQDIDKSILKTIAQYYENDTIRDRIRSMGIDFDETDPEE